MRRGLDAQGNAAGKRGAFPKSQSMATLGGWGSEGWGGGEGQRLHALCIKTEYIPAKMF